MVPIGRDRNGGGVLGPCMPFDGQGADYSIYPRPEEAGTQIQVQDKGDETPLIIDVENINIR